MSALDRGSSSFSPSGGAQAAGARRRVVVTGVGLVTCLGDTFDSLHQGLREGRQGTGPLTLFSADGQPGRRVGEIRGFDPAAYLGNKNFRPLDRTSLLSTVAAHLALAHSGLARGDGAAELAVGLVLGTTFGSIHTISEFDRRGLTAGPNYVKPLDFANSVINAPAGQTAIWHGLAGVNSTLTGGPTAGLQALAYAADLIRGGGGDAVLAGGAEELCFESYFGFGRAGLLAGSRNGSDGECPIPFHPQRNGFALAEGAALLSLEAEEPARARGARILAEVAGHGSAYDPSRGQDPQRAAAAMARSVRLALAEAGLTPEQLDVWISGASGSPREDAIEARGVAAALGERLATLPASAPKSQLGEALGASGALQAIALLGVMATGILPGVAGLERLDPALPALDVVPEARPLASPRRGLLTAVGLDGNNTSVILERRQDE